VRNFHNTICAAQLLHAAQPVTIDRNQRSRSPEYAIGQALSKWAFYVNLYRAQWPTVILAVAAVLLMAVVGWYWPDLRSNLVKAYAGKKQTI